MTAPTIAFALAPGQDVVFAELAEALCSELLRLDARSYVTDSELPEPRSDRVHVLVSPHEFFRLTPMPPTDVVLSRCLLVSAPPPTMPVHIDAHLALARRAGAVLEIDRRMAHVLREAGVAAEHLQLGWTEAWDRGGNAEQDVRDVDVLFLGRLSPRRERLLAGFASVLERFEARIMLSDDPPEHTGASAAFVAGEDKRALLARTKVVLNIHAGDDPAFEWLRAAEAVCGGCAIVSEYSTEADPLLAGEHYMAGAPQRLGVLAAWLAEDDAARTRMVSAARAVLRRDVPLSAGAARLRDAAARVALRPLPATAGRATRLARARSPRKSLPTERQPVPLEHLSVPEGLALRALKAQHQQLSAVRRQLAAIELAIRRPDDPDPRTVREAMTRGWRDAPGAALTVCVPLYNQGETVIEALDSILASTRRDWEVVIVDDASTDDGPELVKGWLDAHLDRRGLLLRHEVNGGLPRARNTAARYARTNRLLMLDADNMLRRRAIERLTGALDGDRSAAFAYGLLERFSNAGTEGLLSVFGWEPSRLRVGNFIDALALLRRDALEALGGFSTDPRLYGWEDWDLWARMAEAGHHGAYVPQILARYRVRPGSMVSISNLSPFDAFAAVAEHAPNLMRGVELPG